MTVPVLTELEFQFVTPKILDSFIEHSYQEE
jgi:hypothetical protein